MLRSEEIRALVQEHGAEGYLQVQSALLEGREVNGRKRKARPEQFSIRALWEGLVGPANETLGIAQGVGRGGYIETPHAFEEAISSTAFPSAVGQLISARVIDGYNAGGYIGDELVETVPSTMRGERMVGFTSLQGPKVVEELMPYEDSSFGEKYVTSTETKRGRILSISEEAVFFDQTGQILLRAQNLGEMARQERERRIIRAVADVASTERHYRPSGVAAQIYTGDPLLSTATPLQDWTDIQEVLTYHAATIRDDRQADDGVGPQPIVWMPRVLLVSTKLAGTAARIIAATEVRGDASNERTTSGNPLNSIVPGLRALASPFLDAAEGADQYDDADDWFMGDFRRQFKYKEIWPLQTFRAPAQNPEQFGRDVVAQFKVREYGDVVATDTRWVIKVNAVT